MKTIVFINILFLIVFTGCISEKKIERKYYTIEIPEGLWPVNNDSIPVINGICEIGQVEINPVYSKNQILNRAGSNEVSYYLYNQWAIRPSDAVEELLREYLEAAGIFQNISTRYTRSIPDYIFWTSISRLELIENKKSSSVHLAAAFRLINNSNDQVILSYKADRIIALQQKDLNLFATEVSRIIWEELNIFSTMIRENRYLFSRSP